MEEKNDIYDSVASDKDLNLHKDLDTIVSGANVSK